MTPAPHLSEAEWEIMKVIWKKRFCSAQNVIDELAVPMSWSSATVKTLLNRLLRKGALRFKKTGKSYLYSPVWSENQCRTREAASFLDRVFDGALSPLLAHFVQSRRLSPKELQELEDILKGIP
jgi:BlaI family transcriptional regulator, penicillinase repressor